VAKEKAEDKIAQSTGSDTEKYGQQLEDEADAIINDMYGKKEASDDKNAKEDKEDDVDPDDKDNVEDDDKDGEDDDVDDKPDKDVDDLMAELDTANKRVKDTRADHTRGRQELAESQAKSLELEDTIFTLKTQMEELTKAVQSKSEAKETKKEIKEQVGDLKQQMAEMEKVDPDMAKAMEPIISNLMGQVTGLKAEMKTKEEAAEQRELDRKAQKEADDTDAHFKKLDDAHDGWEDTMKTKEFSKYLKNLTPRLKRVALLDLKGGKAEDIIEIFDDFKSEQEDDGDETKVGKAKKQTNPANRKSKENNLKGRNVFKFTRTQIHEMGEKEYAEKEDAIDQAMANGQIQNI
jgi:chromosome segregation ATPase